MGKRLLSFASLSVLFACALVVASNVACAAGKDKSAKALMAVDSDWSKAAVARNVDAVASFYAEDGVAYPPNEPIAIGRAAARKVWAAYFADPTFQISWKTTSAEVTNRTGWTVGTYPGFIQEFRWADDYGERQVRNRVAEGRGRHVEGHP